MKNTLENYDKISEAEILRQTVLSLLVSDDFLKLLGAKFINKSEADLNYKMYFSVEFENDLSDNQIREVTKRIEKLLSDNSLFCNLLAPNFPRPSLYVVFPEFVNNKINWRRFVMHPEKFSDKNIKILDTLSEFTELNDFIRKIEGDTLHKFYRFVKEACDDGLITKEEYRNLEAEYHLVAN